MIKTLPEAAATDSRQALPAHVPDGEVTSRLIGACHVDLTVAVFSKFSCAP